jgi:ATP-dependent DNA helicase DinG
VQPPSNKYADEAEVSATVESTFYRLEEVLPSYELRPQQIEFAHSIERSIKEKKVGIFEAGTGTGKSLAALIPAALSRKRVVVSTATIALQEQYIHKDIPCLKTLLPFEIEATLFKGRSNYIGMRRLEDFKMEAEVDPRIVKWLRQTELGDKAELDFVPPFEMWNEIDSDSDDCLRNKCAFFNQCFYFKARKKAELADIIVVNHALLLIDAASGGNILPPYEVLIVDEAHQLPEVASKSFSVEISFRGLQLLAAKASKQVMAPAYIVQNMLEMGEAFFTAVHEIFPMGRTRLRKNIEGARDFLNTVHILRDWLAAEQFETILDVDNQRDKLKLKARALITTCTGFIKCLNLIESKDDEWVLWIDKVDHVPWRTEVVAAPLSVAEFLQQYIFDKEGLESSIWMSATLATAGEDPFQFFKSQVGAPRTRYMQSQVTSPFDYKRQSVLYLPKNMPDPNTREYSVASHQEIENILNISRGRAFVLFTSYSAMNNCFEKLREQIDFPSKRQGEMPRNRLLEWFKETPNAVLFATASFWEGVSVDGDQLSCVIIDRIPFQSPDDPVYEAKCERMKDEEGMSWFSELALPYAIMRLKQGVGRLIRTKTDRGIVAILDPRISTKGYGRTVLSCLPPMKIVRSLRAVTCIDDLLE